MLKRQSKKTIYQHDKLLKSVPKEILVQDGLKVTASHTASTRIGGNVSPLSAFTYEGWSTGINQEKGMWYQVELPTVMAVSEIHFNAPQNVKKGWQFKPNTPIPFIQTYPREFILETSVDGNTWQENIPNIKGNEGENIISLNATKAKFVRIKLEASVPKDGDDIPWSMRQLKIYGQK